MTIPLDAAPPVTGFGPCEVWCAAEDLCDADERPADNELARRIATEVVWSLSGRQYGVCRIDDIRPSCRFGACSHIMAARYFPPWWYSSSDLRENYSRWGRSAKAYDAGRHVRRVLEVVVDGVVLDPSAYRLDDHRWLVRADGKDWPACQDLDRGLDEPGTWAFTIERGRAVPPSGVDAVATLATEIYRARCGATNCRLPRRATQVVRKDLTVTLTDPTVFLEDGRTGLVEVDLFLAAVNRHGLRRNGRVSSVTQLRR